MNKSFTSEDRNKRIEEVMAQVYNMKLQFMAQFKIVRTNF